MYLLLPCTGPAASVSLIPLSARLVYNSIVLLEKAVGPDGEVAFDKVDFNQPPQRYNLTLQLSPVSQSALADDVSGQNIWWIIHVSCMVSSYMPCRACAPAQKPQLGTIIDCWCDGLIQVQSSNQWVAENATHCLLSTCTP